MALGVTPDPRRRVVRGVAPSLGLLAASLLACQPAALGDAPSHEPGPAMSASASAPAAVGPSALSASAAPSSVAATAATSALSAAPAEQPTGECVGRVELKTAGGVVSCYPYRCRDGRCLTSCKARSDCGGSDGPGDLAQNGWPLDCHGQTCVPLPPGHVRKR